MEGGGGSRVPESKPNLESPLKPGEVENLEKVAGGMEARIPEAFDDEIIPTPGSPLDSDFDDPWVYNEEGLRDILDRLSRGRGGFD